jgi:hypothetical protein
VEAVRDLGRVDPWQESLERSLARRNGQRSAGDHRRSRGQPEPNRHRRSRGQPAPNGHRRSRGQPLTRQPKVLAAGSWGVLILAVIMVTTAGLLDGHGAQASAGAARAQAPRGQVTSSSAHARTFAAGLTGTAGSGGTCRPVAVPTGYVNPVAGDVLTGERIDQGVDYAGSGKLSAIGAAKITYVGTTGTGWPGAFIEYRLLDGADAGCLVYYAEGIDPAAGLRPGQTVQAGQVLATIIPGWATGIELGWGSGDSTKTYAAKTGKWTATDDADSIASAAGKDFAALIAALGAPPGRVEG